VVELLNTLYVQKQGVLLRLSHDTVQAKLDGETLLRLPLVRLEAIVVFGNVTVTPFLIHRCAQDGRRLVWLTNFGRFRAAARGSIQGNVLLRRAQHEALSDTTRTVDIARQMVAGKLQNSRRILVRARRETEEEGERNALQGAADNIAGIIERLPAVADLNTLRGAEGEAAREYFSVFSLMLRRNRSRFGIAGRTRRPPRDPLNSLLSFLYALVCSECASGAESVGLDPQVGYLHALRSGRPALALDLMEELRSVLVDRLALTLINRQQIEEKHFQERAGGAVYLTDKGREIVLEAYQKKKEDELTHRVLNRKLPIGLIPHVQATLLARHLRGDLPHYPPYLHR